MGDPQVTIGFNAKSWSHDLDDLGVPPWLRKPPNWINAWYAVTRPKTSAQNIPRPQNVIRARALVSMPSVGERGQKMVTEIQGTNGKYVWKMFGRSKYPINIQRMFEISNINLDLSNQNMNIDGIQYNFWECPKMVHIPKLPNYGH